MLMMIGESLVNTDHIVCVKILDGTKIYMTNNTVVGYDGSLDDLIDELNAQIEEENDDICEEEEPELGEIPTAQMRRCELED